MLFLSLGLLFCTLFSFLLFFSVCSSTPSLIKNLSTATEKSPYYGFYDNILFLYRLNLNSLSWGVLALSWVFVFSPAPLAPVLYYSWTPPLQFSTSPPLSYSPCENSHKWNGGHNEEKVEKRKTELREKNLPHLSKFTRAHTFNLFKEPGEIGRSVNSYGICYLVHRFICKSYELLCFCNSYRD